MAGGMGVEYTKKSDEVELRQERVGYKDKDGQ